MDMEKILEAFRKNRYEASYFATAEEAAEYLDSKIDNKLVGLGDSQTLVALGLYQRLLKHNTVHDVQQSPEAQGMGFKEYAKSTLLTDIFLCSANAVTEDGIVVNMDGTGNRVAASLFGHEKVYYVIGINKICPTLEDAIWRIRNIAAPMNCHRKHKKTPCAIKGDKCYNCSSPERICNGLLIEYKKMSNMDMEVVIIGEKLGF